MRDKEILQELINYYSSALFKMDSTNNTAECLSIAEEYKVQFGICYCAETIFEVDIQKRDWVTLWKVSNFYWCPTVIDQKNNQALMIKSVQYRLNKMREILLIM